MKIDIHKLFEELSGETYFGLNMKVVMMGLGHKELRVLQELVHACRAGRKADPLPPYYFIEQPVLTLSWEEWHSGGGCMVWIHEFCDGMSIFVTDEVVQLSKFNSAHTLDAEFGEGGEEDYWLMTHYLTEEHPEPLSFYLCPFIGQELADLVAKDINEIVRCF